MAGSAERQSRVHRAVRVGRREFRAETLECSHRSNVVSACLCDQPARAKRSGLARGGAQHRGTEPAAAGGSSEPQPNLQTFRRDALKSDYTRRRTIDQDREAQFAMCAVQPPASSSLKREKGLNACVRPSWRPRDSGITRISITDGLGRKTFEHLIVERDKRRAA